MLNKKLDTIFPQKNVKIKQNFDKPFITKELKILDRKAKREYRKNYKSEKYLSLKKIYDEKFRKAAQAYLDKNVRSLKEDDPGKAYQTLKKMSSQPGDCTEDNTFKLSSHVEDNLTDEQSIESIAEHFAQISQEYPPLNRNLLPDEVKAKLDNPTVPDELPSISAYDVYKVFKRSHKPRSSVPGDLPRRIVREFSPELATPASRIFQNIVRTGHWPKQWRTEYGTPLPKIKNPSSENDLRIISLTNYFSKQFEQFVVVWLLQYVGSQLDCGQFGGVKGSSISHYLINFINFILFNQDLAVPQAVVAVMVDFSKAFNRINHNTIITILSKMGVPGWLLTIVIGFLTDRKLVVRHKGKSSKRKALPGGGPQGTKLGLLLFLILINAAGYPHLEQNLGKRVTERLCKRTPLENTHLKYVDDMSIAQAIDMRKCLVKNPDPNQPKPLAYHDRTNHILPTQTYSLQKDLNDLAQYADNHGMVINTNKSKVMIFNSGKQYDGMPHLTLPDMGSDNLEVVEEIKLLGVKLRSDLKWHANTNYICQRGFQRLWIVRRLRNLGATVTELLDVYDKQVRSVLELAVPVWQPALTKQESKQIERVQRSAFYIILGDDYKNYENALIVLEKETLEERRLKLCQNFAKKSIKNPKFENWFCPSDPTSGHSMKTRSSNNKITYKLKPVQTRTARYENSPIPFLTKLLNNL